MPYFSMKPFLFVLSLSLLSSISVLAEAVRYELRIANQKVNITGKEVDFAITVNGSIPAPTLEFTEGDDAEIKVINELSNDEASIHWHGILLPPEEDGVPYVATPPIFPGNSRTFKFKVRQHGTYWYHSHTSVQEQKGVYGAFIIYPKKQIIKTDKDAVVVLSDWSDENADQILKNLRKDGDYYQYKKKSVRSIFGAIQAGQFKTYLKNEWSRMGGMDISDVAYDAFLINGKAESQLLAAQQGEKVRLRIINAGASSYFFLTLGNQPLNVISADGIDIEPINVKELLIGSAETYDIVFTVPSGNKNYELRATAQDVTGFASTWIGMGEKVSAPTKPEVNLYASMSHQGMSNMGMDHSKMDAKPMDHSKMDMEQSKNPGTTEQIIETLSVDNIKSKESTLLPENKKIAELKLVLGGDMERYVWHINGKAIHEERDILINEGDIVRFTFVNETMMHHPMHLHGHFFRVLNKYGDFSPLKHTVDVPPMETRTIEFYADEPGQWMLHCHNLYHLKTGMARVVKYISFKPSADVLKYEKSDPHLMDHWYTSGLIQAATNFGEGRLRLSQTWNEIDARIETRKDDKWKPEGDLFFRRWISNYFNLVAGGTAVDKDYRGVVGLGYRLPLLFETNLLVDHKGKLRLDVGKRFQWTTIFFSEVEFILRQDSQFKSDYAISLMYGTNWTWAAGLKYTGESLGAGFQYRF